MLEPLGLQAPFVQAVSPGGEVVGVGDTGSHRAGYRVSAAGAARLVPEPSDAWFRAVNSQGLIAGQAIGPQSLPMAWDAEDRPTDLTPKLPLFGGRFSGGGADAVNESGQVAGAYQVLAPGTFDEVVWTLVFVWDSRTDQLTIVNPEAATRGSEFSLEGSPVGIDDQGVVAFSFYEGPGNAQMARMVPQPGGTYRRELFGTGLFRAMNARGDILGVAGPTSQPVVWPAGASTATVLPPPPGWTPTSLFAYSAVDINARGEVVGVYTNRGTEVRPMRWPTATQPPEMLETDNRLSIDVQGIGDDGTIIGTWFASPAGAPSTTVIVNPSNRRALVWDPVR